jgi:hypothetical protein
VFETALRVNDTGFLKSEVRNTSEAHAPSLRRFGCGKRIVPIHRRHPQRRRLRRAKIIRHVPPVRFSGRSRLSGRPAAE